MDIATTVPAFETIRTATVTPKGEAVIRIYRALVAIRQLPAEDRADVLALLVEELAS